MRHPIDTQAEAASRRDDGMELAADAAPNRVTLGRLALLSALLRSPDGTGTIDDATDADLLAIKYADGGKWRGAVTRSLAADGYTERVGTVESRRTSRHCGYIGLWRLIDRDAARRHIERIRSALSQYEKTDSMGSTTEPASNSQTNPKQKEKNNGQAI